MENPQEYLALTFFFLSFDFYEVIIYIIYQNKQFYRHRSYILLFRKVPVR